MRRGRITESSEETDFPESLGVIIETPGFLPGYSARQNLQFLAGIRGKIGKKEIDEAIRKVGLDPEAKKHVGKYSLGMRQRLGIAQAIMEDPSVIILDEPMNGLDNEGVEEMRKLFLELKAEGSLLHLRYQDIIYAEHFAHIINIRTTAEKTFATRQSFKTFTEPLKKDPRFFVCGRGVIVNLEHAADFRDGAFCMTDGSSAYVSQELLKPARQAFMEFLLQRGRVG